MLKLPYENSKVWLQNQIERLKEARANDDDYIEYDERHYVRLGWIVLVVGFLGFMVWAFFAPLDKGVPSSGTVIADGQRKTIQAPQNGMIEEILVKDGDEVKEGQILVRMNNLQANAQARGVQEAIIGLTAQIKGVKESISNKEMQLSVIKEQLTNLQELTKDGYVPRNRFLEMQRNYLQINGSLSEDRGNLVRYESQLREQEEREKVFTFELSNADIKSPVDGSVVNLEVFTRRGVVGMGAHLMDIQPDKASLVVEARVPVQLIDKVHIGLPVEILFPAFNQRSTPNIPGVVTVVPNDRTQDNRTGEVYYKIQVQVTDQGRKKLRDNQIRPGMPAEVFVVTGQRTMMSYLLKPIFDRMHSAFREE